MSRHAPIRLGRRTLTVTALGLPLVALLAGASLVVLVPEDDAPASVRPAPPPAARVVTADPRSAPTDVTFVPAHPTASPLPQEPDPVATALDRLDAPDSTPLQRADALRTLTQASPRQAVHRLTRVLAEGTDDAVEAEALRQLGPLLEAGALEPFEAQRLLLASLERTRNPEVALAADQTLASLDETGEAQVYDALARAALPAARVVLVRALARQGHLGTVRELATSDPSPHVRSEALALTLRAEEGRSAELLFEALERDPAVRRTATRLLARLPWSDRHELRLIQLLSTTDDPTFARELTRSALVRGAPSQHLTALALGGDRAAVAVAETLAIAPTGQRAALLRKVLTQGLNPSARAAALQGLTRARQLGDADLQTILANDASPQVRTAAQRLLARLQTEPSGDGS